MTEAGLRETLLASRRHVLHSPEAAGLRGALQRMVGQFSTAYVLAHTPGQGNDLYRVLVDGRVVVSCEISRLTGLEDISESQVSPASDYGQLLRGKPQQLLFLTAVELSRADMK